MSLPLLKTALLLPLEHLLNTLIATDAAGPSRLAAMEGKVLAVKGENPAFSLFVSTTAGKLHLAVIHEGPVTTTLKGPTSGMMKLLLRKGDVHSLQPLGLVLTGETGFMTQLQNLLLDLQVDWEYHLARLTGDIPVQQLREGLEHGRAFAGRFSSRLQEDFREYVTEEARLLPTTDEAEQLYRAITDLVLRLDRLEAGVDQHRY